MKTPCLDAETVAAYAANVLDPAERARVDEHIDTCASCRMLVSSMAMSAFSTRGSSSGELSTDPAAPMPTLQRGTRIGAFEVLEVLEAGGMGIVYAALDSRLDRRVALKCVRDRRSDATQLLTEARMMAQLTHPNVVPVYDVVEESGQIYLAMELVVGRSLRMWAESAPRTWQAVVDVFIEAAKGLAAAHAAGVVHGDVKPSNVLVGDDGRVRVTDFGLASLESDSGHGVLRGTPAYMAPEQHEGKKCDAKADQYSFCVSLHEALFGSLPGKPPTRTRAVPRGVKRILARGLSIEPAARFASMQDLVRSLTSTRSTRLRWASAAAVIFAVSGAAAFLFGGRRVESELCEAAAAELVSPWTDQNRERVRHAFLSTKLSYAPETLARVEALFDVWQTGFAEAQAKNCGNTWSRPPHEQLAPRLKCLGEVAREARGLISIMRGGDGPLVLNSISLVQGLRPASSCDVVLQGPAPSPKLGPETMALRDDFVKERLLGETGHPKEALELAKDLLARATAMGADTFIAPAKVRLGADLYRLGQFDLGADELREAIRISEVTQDDRTRASAWVTLVQLEYKRGRHELVTQLELPALGACERVGDVWLRTETMLMTGGSRTELGQFDKAKALFDQAVELRVKTYGTMDARSASALSAKGNALAMAGDLEQGLEAHERALLIGAAALGQDHPRTGILRANVGDDFLYGLRSKEALTELGSAVKTLEAVNPESREVANTLNDFAFAQLIDGDAEGALANFEKVLGIWAKVAPQHPVKAMTLLGKYQATKTLGRAVDVQWLKDAVPLSKFLPPFERGRILVELGEVTKDQAMLIEAEKALSSTTLPLIARERERAKALIK